MTLPSISACSRSEGLVCPKYTWRTFNNRTALYSLNFVRPLFLGSPKPHHRTNPFGPHTAPGEAATRHIWSLLSVPLPSLAATAQGFCFLMTPTALVQGLGKRNKPSRDFSGEKLLLLHCSSSAIIMYACMFFCSVRREKNFLGFI